MEGITYEDLRVCAALAREARDMKDRMEALRILSERCTPQFSGTPGRAVGFTSDPVGSWAVKLDEYERVCNVRIEAYMEHILEVEMAIQGVPDGTQRTILRQRYIDGLTWEEISERTHYSESWLKKLHRWGLNALGFGLGEEDTKRYARM